MLPKIQFIPNHKKQPQTTSTLKCVGKVSIYFWPFSTVLVSLLAVKGFATIPNHSNAVIESILMFRGDFRKSSSSLQCFHSWSAAV